MLLAVALGIAIGWMRGGRLKRLNHVPFQYVWLAVVAFLVQTGAQYWAGFPGDFVLYVLSYFLLLVVLLHNRSLPGLSWMALGVGLNLLVIGINGGMPVATARLYPEVYRAVALGDHAFYHLMGSGTSFPFLGDHLLIPHPWSAGFSLLSPGDLVMMLGVIYFIVRGMQPYRNNRRRRIS